nr:MAG TPA: hypothetical protein [Caudoviricetes sp.]
MVVCKIAKAVWRALTPLGGFSHAPERRPTT